MLSERVRGYYGSGKLFGMSASVYVFGQKTLQGISIGEDMILSSKSYRIRF